MADQRENEVRKGAHCVWQIHYHIVFPVTYRKALLDEEVTGIIQETAAEIADRFPIEMEAIGTDKHLFICSAVPIRKWRLDGLCRCSSASRPGNSFAGSLPSNECCGAENFGPTVLCGRRLESGQTGRQSNGMCNGKGNPVKSSGSSIGFSSVVPRSLLRGLH